MFTTDTRLQYSAYAAKKESGTPVIIVAAGNSTRMRGINKQFLHILGVPVIARTLMAFESCEDISKIIVVTSGNSINDIQLICDKYMINKVTDIVEGGSNRHASVMKGIECLNTDDKHVLIHDGARPFVDKNTISDVANALNSFDAALCVAKINDTVKKVSEEGTVIETVDRSMLYAAQTPQGVNVKKYLDACNHVSDTESFTDDVSIMEAAGYGIKAIIGSSKNIKITTPDDIAIAEALVKGEVES